MLYPVLPNFLPPLAGPHFSEVSRVAVNSKGRIFDCRGEATIANLRLSPDMRELYDAFIGAWRVSEVFEVGGANKRATRQGTACFRIGPGASLIEEYQSRGSAGELRFLALVWWDESAHVYRLLTCANNDGCQLRGTAKWEGQALVNAWEEKVDGKTVTFKDSFVNILPSSFRLVSEGRADGKTIWLVKTKYERRKELDQ